MSPLNPECEQAGLVAVVPLTTCPHLEQVNPVPASGIAVDQACKACPNAYVGENWVCLTCYQAHCSRYVNEHAVQHAISAGHPMALSLSDLSVWCYECNAYVHHESLISAKSSAHLSKFGEPSPDAPSSSK